MTTTLLRFIWKKCCKLHYLAKNWSTAERIPIFMRRSPRGPVYYRPIIIIWHAGKVIIGEVGTEPNETYNFNSPKLEFRKTRGTETIISGYIGDDKGLNHSSALYFTSARFMVPGDTHESSGARCNPESCENDRSHHIFYETGDNVWWRSVPVDKQKGHDPKRSPGLLLYNIPMDSYAMDMKILQKEEALVWTRIKKLEVADSSKWC